MNTRMPPQEEARKILPQEEARKILRQLKLSRPPILVEKVARHLGANIKYTPFDGEISGIVYILAGVPIIVVNSLHRRNRQRFTIAHECGHLVMHRHLLNREVHVDRQFSVLRRDTRSSSKSARIEDQANQFAVELTMPEPMLEGVIRRIAEDYMIDIDDSIVIKKLAREFRMSENVMKIRLGNLF
jgi:Zn-dependent peptidase ImmA (M78 family)